MGEESTCAFVANCVEPSTSFVSQYILSYWDSDHSVSMYDTKNKRMFLKRTIPSEKINLGMLYIGANVTVCSRPLRIVDFGDASTRRKFASVRGSSVVLVKPNAYHDAGKVVQMLYDADLAVGRMRMVRWTAEEAGAFLGLGSSASAASSSAASASAESPSALSKDHMLAIEVAGEDIISRTHEVVGPSSPSDAREAAPRSIRAMLGGASRADNVVFTSPDMETAAKQVAHIFERRYPTTAVYNNCSLLLIRPHAVVAKQTGAIIDSVLRSELEVSAVRSMALSRDEAADLLEPYKGVVPDFERWVKELSSGPCVAVEVRGDMAVHRLRELAGPHDSVLAKALRPDTLRARFGVDSTMNAVHVTDIEVDGPLECKFIFHVLNH
jgi:nucleoside-diphosphate kinase